VSAGAGRFADRHERLAALRIAHDVLRESWPRVQVPCQVRLGPNQLDATAVLHFPGIVRVTLRLTGELVAQSKPGRPLDLDAAAS
jgi:hypothetical protein